MLHYENCMMDSELVESCMQAQASKAGARAATVGIQPTYLLVGTVPLVRMALIASLKE